MESHGRFCFVYSLCLVFVANQNKVKEAINLIEFIFFTLVYFINRVEIIKLSFVKFVYVKNKSKNVTFIIEVQVLFFLSRIFKSLFFLNTGLFN